MAELESKLEAFFRERVRSYGGHCVKLAPTERGVPDRLVILPPNRMFLVELKTDEGKLSPIQQAWHNKLFTYQGVRVHTLYGRGQIVAWLTRVVAAGGRDSASRTQPRTGVN